MLCDSRSFLLLWDSLPVISSTGGVYKQQWHSDSELSCQNRSWYNTRCWNDHCTLSSQPNWLSWSPHGNSVLPPRPDMEWCNSFHEISSQFSLQFLYLFYWMSDHLDCFWTTHCMDIIGRTHMMRLGHGLDHSRVWFKPSRQPKQTKANGQINRVQVRRTNMVV